jgi:TonB-dependent receptor
MHNQSFRMRRLTLALAIGAVLNAVPLSAQETPAQTPAVPQSASGPQAVDEGSATDLDRVEVIGVRDALFNARARERDTDVISNVVTADDAGQFADQNVAESLQRVPGVSIDRDAGEGRRVTVRGLGAQFNPVTINGMLLATSDLDRDAVVDVLPNDLLGTLTVTKTLTPDMDASAIGGAVDLRAVDPYERENGGLLRAEAGRAEYADGLDPKLSGSVNQLLDLADGGKFGFSLSGSYSQRDLVGDIVRNRETPFFAEADGTDDEACEDANDGNAAVPSECFLATERVENRVDYSERTRYGAAANFDYKPNDNHEFYLRLIGSRYKLNNVQYVDRFQWDEIEEVGPNTLTASEAQYRKQTTFLKRNETTALAQLGGTSRTDDWIFDYWVGGSRNRLEVPEQLTGRFRARDIVASYEQRADGITVTPSPGEDEDADPSNPANYEYDQLTLITEDRVDKILQAKIDARRDFSFGDRGGFFQLGAKLHRRDKTADRVEIVGDPSDLVEVTLADVGIRNLTTNIPNFGFQPDSGAARRLFRSTQDGVLGDPNPENSAAQSYTVEEDIDAAYAMASFDLSERFTLFGGVRFESTDWNTSGFQVEELIELDEDGEELDPVFSVTPVNGLGNSYNDVLPSLHMRWEPTDTLVVRGSLSTAIVRPNFDEASATRSVSTEEQDDGTYERDFSGGNPLLDPLTARQADLSIAWYPSEGTFLYAGLFYKRIDDFYIEADLVGDAVALVGLPIADGTIDGGFDSAEVFINGNRATVRGLELAYEQAFVNLPGWLSGLFVSGNLTFVDSKADYSNVGRGSDLPLPDQADRIANLSLGWENEQFTFRMSANYRDEQLDIVGSRPEFDQVLTDFFSVDVNVRWNVSDAWQIYFDAGNINGEKDATVYRGGRDGAIPAEEGGIIDFGRSYVVGVRYNF